METSDLFNGIAVIIDDEIGKKAANINELIKQIEDKNIPCVKYTYLPENDVIKHLQGISFLILDWRIRDKEIEEFMLDGVISPSTLEESIIQANIDFLKKLRDKCFIPIFIFTNEDETGIIMKLKESGLYNVDKPNFIFVKQKSDLKDDNLFDQINSWIQTVPPIYALKEWEREYREAKNRMFGDFYKLSPSWPKILCDTFSADGANMSKELGGIITRNLHTRMTPFSFNVEVFARECAEKVSLEELRRVLEGERYVTQLHNNEIATGDLFKEEYIEKGAKNYRYYLNIRAQCDLVHGNLDKTELYCLRGRTIDESKINEDDGTLFNDGQFIEKINNAIVPFIDNGKIIEFLFRDLKQLKWKDWKEKRIGRLLPPYITRIQQRYALYLQRQGLPRIPEVVVFGNSIIEKTTEFTDDSEIANSSISETQTTEPTEL